MILLGQRALSSSDADSQLFSNRSAELRRTLRALHLGLNIYVHGPPGIGRTSFLRQIQRAIPEARYVRLHGFETLTERLDEIERGLVGQHVLSRQGPNPLAAVFNQLSSTTLKAAEDPFRHLRAAVRQLQEQPSCVMLVDDLDLTSVHEMFGRWRDTLWELPIQWVVSGSGSHLEPPADSFFDAIVELSPFDYDGLHELVRRRAESGTPEEREVLQRMSDSALEAVAPCTPRRALSVIRDLYLSDDLELEASRLRDIQESRSHLKATAIKILDALESYGPTHAGDELLLAEAGVTRSRVVQVLAELEAGGLVTAERSGRRKLYAAYPKSATGSAAETDDLPARETS